MRVLQIANGYLNTRVYSLLCPALERQGVEETVFVPVKRGTANPGCPDNVHIVPCFDDLDRVLFYRKQKSMLRWLENNTDLESFDVIHAHTVFSGGYAAYQIHKRYGTPYIVAVRSTDVDTFFKYMVHLRSLGVEIMRHAAAVIFLSPAYHRSVLEKWVPEQYRQEIREKSRVIPNGIAPIFLDTPAQPRTGCHDPLRVIYVGKLNAIKNPELTIAAVKQLRDKGMNVTLTTIGKPGNKKYEAILGSEDFITHLGERNQAEIIHYLQEADVFVMPSHTETFGLVYAEAMSQGLPVLYTAGQGFDGHFPDGTVGYAVSDRDASDVAEKICMAAENYEALSKAAISGVRRFNWDEIAQTYWELYHSITR